MSDALLTPADVQAALGVSGSTFRRTAQEYETLWGALERDPISGGRMWPLAAAQVVQAATLAVTEKRAPSIRAALVAIHEGRDLPAAPPLPGAPGAAAELASLSARLDAQAAGVVELLSGLASRDAEIAEALRELAQAQHRLADAHQAHAGELAALRAEVASATPAQPPPTPRRGLLARLLAAVVG